MTTSDNLSDDPFAGPIDTLRREMNAVELVLRTWHKEGGGHDYLKRRVAEHKNAIETLEALRGDPETMTLR
jgi:hypothetical protein